VKGCIVRHRPETFSFRNFLNGIQRNMRTRVDVPELLDDDLGTRDEIQSSLADLRRINRWFGGISTSQHLLSRVFDRAQQSTLSVLEVGGATGDTPAELVSRFRTHGKSLEYTIVDRSPAHLNGRFRSIAGDAVALPFRDASFDVVSCALLVHHFAPEEIIRFVRDALRVARHAVVINDLRRTSMHLALIYAGMPLYRSRLTRHDTVASVRRAYTPGELRKLIGSNFTNSVELSTYYLYRMGVIVWK
jgi:SAM-dependent methyltransferase